MMEKWEHASNYMGESFTDYFVLLSHSRDSRILEESNWYSAIKILDEKKAEYQIIRSSHWLCGWVEMIIIHENNQDSIDIGNDILEQIEKYPVLDDSDFSDREWEAISELADQIQKDIENLDTGESLKGWGDGITRDMTRDQIIDEIQDSGMVEI